MEGKEETKKTDQGEPVKYLYNVHKLKQEEVKKEQDKEGDQNITKDEKKEQDEKNEEEEKFYDPVAEAKDDKEP